MNTKLTIKQKNALRDIQQAMFIYKCVEQKEINERFPDMMIEGHPVKLASHAYTQTILDTARRIGRIVRRDEVVALIKKGHLKAKDGFNELELPTR